MDLLSFLSSLSAGQHKSSSPVPCALPLAPGPPNRKTTSTRAFGEFAEVNGGRRNEIETGKGGLLSKPSMSAFLLRQLNQVTE